MLATSVKSHLNIYWLASTAIAVWFLFVHAPPILKERRVWNDPPFLLHLLGSYVIYLACIHNTLITPSIWKQAKFFHVWIGRVGLILGVTSFVFGFYITWTRVSDNDMGFSVSITIGGILQLYTEYQGYRAIRKYKELKARLQGMEQGNENDDTKTEELMREKDKALKDHIDSMLGLFVIACGVPAIIRLLANVDGVWPIFAVIGIMNVVVILYGKTFEKIGTNIAQIKKH